MFLIGKYRVGFLEIGLRGYLESPHSWALPAARSWYSSVLPLGHSITSRSILSRLPPACSGAGLIRSPSAALQLTKAERMAFSYLDVAQAISRVTSLELGPHGLKTMLVSRLPLHWSRYSQVSFASGRNRHFTVGRQTGCLPAHGLKESSPAWRTAGRRLSPSGCGEGGRAQGRREGPLRVPQPAS